MEKSKELASFIKLNKVARQKRAVKNGFADADQYLNFLKNGSKPAVPVEEKKISRKQSKKKAAEKGVGLVVSGGGNSVIIHIVDIVDRSGSMLGSKIRAAAEGLNRALAALKQGEEGVKYTHTLCDFESKVMIKHVMTDVHKVGSVGIATYGSTALFDAIGKTVVELEKKRKDGEKVLVNIYTDGQENASREYTADTIREMIDTYSNKGYTFTFVGTKYDVDYVNNRLHIDTSNSLVYDGTAKDLERGINETIASRQTYSKKVVRGEDVSKGFYKNIKK